MHCMFSHMHLYYYLFKAIVMCAIISDYNDMHFMLFYIVDVLFF